MTRTSRKQGKHLRQTIRQQAEGDIIDLGLGFEYQGPIIIDKPITLRGQGRSTVLFGQGTPALVIRAPGVNLEDLELADSFDPDQGICLLVEEAAQPNLTRVITNGQIETVSQEQVINFGEIMAGQNASTFIELNITEPTIIECAKNSAEWLHLQIISPEQASGGLEQKLDLVQTGRYMIRLVCMSDSLLSGDIILGKLHVIAQKISRPIWAYAHVVSEYSSIPLNEGLALITDAGQCVRVQDSYLIGQSNSTSLRNHHTLSEQQAFILRDNNNAWAIFQPWLNTVPTLVNGLPLSFGQRVWLSEGDIIEAGDVQLTVEATEDKAHYLFDKIVIDLGSTNKPAVNPQFQLTFQGNAEEQVRLTNSINWIDLHSNTISLQPGDVHTIHVTLNTSVLNLSPQKHTVVDAIQISGKTEQHTLAVCFEAEVVETESTQGRETSEPIHASYSFPTPIQATGTQAATLNHYQATIVAMLGPAKQQIWQMLTTIGRWDWIQRLGVQTVRSQTQDILTTLGATTKRGLNHARVTLPNISPQFEDQAQRVRKLILNRYQPLERTVKNLRRGEKEGSNSPVQAEKTLFTYFLQNNKRLA
ncbi:MAG: hypothetical protein AAF629_17555, partial [Chloroflexota bacterium]